MGIHSMGILSLSEDVLNLTSLIVLVAGSTLIWSFITSVEQLLASAQGEVLSKSRKLVPGSYIVQGYGVRF